jgi:hypothetical protein
MSNPLAIDQRHGPTVDAGHGRLRRRHSVGLQLYQQRICRPLHLVRLGPQFISLEMIVGRASLEVLRMRKLLRRSPSWGHRIQASLAVVATLCALLVPRPAASHDAALMTWANAALDRAEDYRIKPVKTAIDDHFNHDLISGGHIAETPCSGTSWVYDYRHHIAAGRDRGSGPLQIILYANDPPTKVPSRDLSSVESAHGLHLGMTSSEVAKMYRVSTNTIVKLSNGRRVLSLEKDVKCGSWICGHDKIVVFESDRVVSISLHDHGP